MGGTSGPRGPGPQHLVPSRLMRCPQCDAEETRVIDSRPVEAGVSIRRRRRCTTCGYRFTTYERRQAAVMVLKRDGSRERFRPDKVRAGLERALADRPVPAGAVDQIVKRVEAIADASGRELTTEDVGREVLAGLRGLDDVAYLRFASVYKEFQGAQDFEREMAHLEADGLSS